MQYTLKLSDGTELTGFTKNGDNYVSESEVDESVFKSNLSEMTVSSEEGEINIYHNVELVQQTHYSDGWYLAFRELSAQELRDKELDAKLEYIAMMADVDMMEV